MDNLEQAQGLDSTHFDVAIVGGGMVGAAAALGLAKQGKRGVMFETHHPKAFAPEQAIDLRVSALSMASVSLLRELGGWQYIEAMRLCPYRELHTWEQPDNKLRFSAEQLGLPELGFMLENRVVQLGLWQACEQAGVTVAVGDAPQLVANNVLENKDEQVELRWQQQSITAELLVVADGGESKMREALGIGISAWDYRQRCFAINIQLDAEQQDITWQQFTPSGPRALLPLAEQHAALIWYDSAATTKRLQALSDAQLKQAIIDNFPPLPGDFTIIARAAFPLRRRHALSYHKGRAVVIGDAAHTINPLAGQGVNLGYRDVATLLTILAAQDSLRDPSAALKAFQAKRMPDNLLMQGAMDAFYLGFSNDIAPLKMLRGLGLKAAQNSGKLKDWALRYALGMPRSN
ncbi:FAD-dependent monooxygenase [Aliagarivorans marinus]|uniref:FAD-dependent monooxygenase n=1 Tax=Aliagarivorans marinus TaxID=561965 RepID=UPI000421A122|nr:FAD-dependent monooxygenase [Aliagarivorans marinus]